MVFSRQPANYTKLREGWLEKQQPRGLLWQSRWFVLTPLSLRYYVSEPADEVGLLDEAPRCNGGENASIALHLHNRPHHA
eukprot:COSAG01_NODE_11592_length_1897_cov_18.711902_4_plen_80_part_00